MASSIVKGAILVVVVVAGILLLRGGFPEGATAPVVSGAGTTSPAGASPSVSGSPTVPASPRVKGVTVQLLNGTLTIGLATEVSDTLKADGYKVRKPGNAPTTRRTVVYYQPGFELEARHLRDRRFPGARVQAAPDSVPENLDLQVIIGTDF